MLFPDFHLLTSSDDCVRKKPVVCALIFVVRGLIAIVRSSPLNWDIVGYYQLFDYVGFCLWMSRIQTRKDLWVWKIMMIIIQTLRLNLSDPLSSSWFLEIFNFWGYKQDMIALSWIAYYCPSKHLCSADDKTLLKIVCKEGKFGITTPAKSGNILEQWKPMQWTPLQFENPLFIYFRADTLDIESSWIQNFILILKTWISTNLYGKEKQFEFHKTDPKIKNKNSIWFYSSISF